MKVLFIVPYPTEGASNRYRVEQYLPYLEEQGIRCQIRPFMTRAFYRLLHRRGQLLKKAFYFLGACLKRTGDLFWAFRSDVIFIHREAAPVGPPLFEWCCWLMGKPVIFDFDDAIFLSDTSRLSPAWRFLKCSWKVGQTIRISRAVLVANHTLAVYVRRYHERVWVIPTVVDPEYLRMRREREQEGPPVIGWIGTPSTSGYLERILPVFQTLAQKHPFVLRVVGASRAFEIPGVWVENREWSLTEEWHCFLGLDIGVHPLPDDPWARGKAAFKTIQYMTAGVPVIASPIGMNGEVVQDGVNGFLASTEAEWVQKLSLLLEDPSLRKRFGEAGRRTIEERYTSHIYRDRLASVVRNFSVEPRCVKSEEIVSIPEVSTTVRGE